MRVIDWSITALNQVIALPTLRPDVELGGNIDQDAMAWVFAQKGNREHVLYQPLEWHNLFHLRYNDWPKLVEPGDLLVHFAGLKGDSRVDAMNYWLDRVEREPEKLALPADQTNIPGDVEIFWSLYRSAMDAKNTGQKFVDDYSMDSIKDNTLKEKLVELQNKVDDLELAVEENANESGRLRDCLERVSRALKAAEDAQTAFVVKGEEEAKRKEEAAAAAAAGNNNEKSSTSSSKQKADSFSDQSEEPAADTEEIADTSGDNGKSIGGGTKEEANDKHKASGKKEAAIKDDKSSSQGRFSE